MVVLGGDAIACHVLPDAARIDGPNDPLEISSCWSSLRASVGEVNRVVGGHHRGDNL